MKACFDNLMRDNDFYQDFRKWIKENYDDLKKDMPNLPKRESILRQLNRMKSYVDGKQTQKRSGRKTYDDYMKDLFDKFFHEGLDDAIRACLGGRQFAMPSGAFFGFMPPEADMPRANFRGAFGDYQSLINKLGELVATVPYPVACKCGRELYIMG